MATIVTRAGKGSPLTNTEVDSNFSNLNNDKLESGSTASSLTITSADINGGTIDGVTIGGSSAGAITGTTITGTSFVSSGDMTFGDNDKAIFGAGSDLQIYHDGSNSYVSELGTGDLRLGAVNIRIGDNTSGASYIYATQNAEVSLYYNNSTKLATTSTGIDVTGTVTADGLTVESATTPTINIKSTDTTVIADDVVGAITFEESDATGGTGVQAFIKAIANDSGSTYDMSIGVGGNTEAIRIDQTGNVGIGTSSPSTNLHVKSSSITKVIAQSERTVSTENIGAFRFMDSTGQEKSGMKGTVGGDLIFDIGNVSEAMRITSSGNVGIGTSSPSAALDIQGGTYGLSIGSHLVSSQSDIALTSNSVINGDTSLNLCANSYLSFYTGTTNRLTGTAGGTERMRIDSSGNVGIGTSSPFARLTVSPESGNFNSTYNDYDGVGLFLLGNGTAGNGNYGPAVVFGACISTGTEDDKHAAISSVQTGADPNQMGLAFWVHSSGTSTDPLVEAMRIDSAGNVGIGTSSPSSFGKFAVTGATGTVSVNSTGIRLHFSRPGTSYIEATDAAGLLSFGTGGTDTNRMVIDSSGDVGIGTTSPDRKLTVFGGSSGETGAINANSLLFIENSTDAFIETRVPNANYTGIRFSDNTETAGGIGYAHNGATENNELTLASWSSITFRASGVSGLFEKTEHMRINIAGEITMPAVYSDTVTGRDLYIASNGQLGYVSSVRASKTNIEDLPSIDWLYQLNPVKFQYRTKDEEENYTDEADAEIQYGLIAEDVAEVNPDLVFGDETENGFELRGIQYSRLIAPMLKAIQEQQALIQELETRIAALESN